MSGYHIISFVERVKYTPTHITILRFNSVRPALAMKEEGYSLPHTQPRRLNNVQRGKGYIILSMEMWY